MSSLGRSCFYNSQNKKLKTLSPWKLQQQPSSSLNARFVLRPLFGPAVRVLSLYHHTHHRDERKAPVLHARPHATAHGGIK